MKTHRILKTILSLAAFCSLTTQSQAFAGILDVYCGFSTEKKQAEGGRNSLMSKILSSVAIMNDACLNSGVDMRTNFVGFKEYNYNPNGRDILDDVANNLGGLDIAAQQAEWGADLGMMIVSGPVCGVAQTPGIFSYVNCLGQHTLAHEIGHTFGLRHGVGTSISSSYANGYIYNGSGSNPTTYKTIMIGNSADGVMNFLFSNPNVSFGGAPTGNSTSADAARHLREVMTSKTSFANIRPTWRSGVTARWSLVNKGSKKGVHNTSASNANGNPLSQLGNLAQTTAQWWLEASPASGLVNIRNVQSGKYMTAGWNPPANTQVVQWSGYPAAAAQQYALDFYPDGYVSVRSASGGLVIHNSMNSTADNNPLRMYQHFNNRAFFYEIRYIVE